MLINMGYIRKSISERGLEAYQNGEKPKSVWTKALILQEIKPLVDKEKYILFSKIKKNILIENFLYQSSWHHTSKFYNKTNFYSLDTSAIEKITTLELEELSKEKKKEEKTKIPVLAEYSEYIGTKKNFSILKYKEYGYIEGNTFTNLHGKKKRVSGKYFFYEEVSEEEIKKAKANGV